MLAACLKYLQEAVEGFQEQLLAVVGVHSGHLELHLLPVNVHLIPDLLLNLQRVKASSQLDILARLAKPTKKGAMLDPC